MTQHQRQRQKYTRATLNELSDKEYLNFVNALKSARTRRQYTYCILDFMKFVERSTIADLVYSFASTKDIEQRLIDYAVYMRDQKKIAYSTRNTYLAAALCFYSLNDVTLNKKKILRYLGETTREHQDRAYTTEEIHLLLDFVDLRLRSIILLLVSCGCRVGALPSLTISNLTLISDYHLYRITIYEGTRDEYFSFTTPEATKAIKDYLQYRERYGERLTPKSPLFREQFNINDQLKIARPHKLHIGGIHTIVDRALIKAGLREIEHETEQTVSRGRTRKEVKQFNGFRKFFNTNLVRAKVNPAVKEMLMGHSLDLDDNYYRPGSDDLLQEYLKAVDLLTINEENRLKRKVIQLTEKADRFDSLEEKIEKLNRKLGLEQ